MENPFSAPPSLSSPPKSHLPVPPPLLDETVDAAKTSLPPIKPELNADQPFQAPTFSSPGSESNVEAPPVVEAPTETDTAESVFGFGSEGVTPSPATPKPKPKPEAHHQTAPSETPAASHHQPLAYANPEGWSDSDFDEHDGSVMPALAMEEKSCRVCKYFQFDDATRAEVRFGECRRNAPEGVGKAVWPSVLWDSWCGEWNLGVGQDEMMQMVRSAGADSL